MLKHALVIALVVGCTAPLAQADLIPGDPITIVGTNDLGFGWGTGIFGGLPHPFGGQSIYADNFFGLPIIVTSGELPPPDGKKFAGFIRIDHAFPDYLFFFAFEHIDIVGLKEPGQINFINSVESNIGIVTTDGFNISFDASTQDILNGGVTITIQWTQSVIPAPGSLALLGLAGLCGTRRRRR